MQQSAVEWLVKEFNLESYDATVKFAKEKERQQQGHSEQDMIQFMQFIISEEELKNTTSVSLETAKYFLDKFKKNNKLRSQLQG
jgi:hypothetical protein